MDENLADELNECSKTQLVDIVGQLTEEFEEVRAFLRLLLASRRGNVASLAIEDFQERIDEVFQRANWDRNASQYEATVRLARALQGFANVADELQTDDQIDEASMRYTYIARRITDEYMRFHDSSGEFGGLLYRILHEIADLFPNLKNASTRESVRADLEAVRNFEENELSMGLTDVISDCLNE